MAELTKISHVPMTASGAHEKHHRVAWVSFDLVGLRCLEAASTVGARVVGILALPASEHNPAGWCDFSEIAGRLGAPILETTDINSQESLRAVERWTPDMIFVVGWSQLLQPPIIGLAAQGVFGMHPTLLPRHRGRAPIPWTILSGLAKTGVSLFEIDNPTADTGAVVGQIDVLVDPHETATTLYDKILQAHVTLIKRYVPLLIAGSARRHSQDPRRASFWPKRIPADGIIDWDTRADALYGWVRAQTRPYPGAYTYFDQRKLVVWTARPIKGHVAGQSGTVVAHEEEGVVVICGDGLLLLQEVELEELEPWVGATIARHVQIGTKLG
jgi:methionyl-tRNA formyltransferase